ncbi:ovochymase-2-like [Eurosta solidaginis]|uniref:ovochymase-2-like n=1 Tax=Eurosta solidaginis TaxID=178769 RepID=UPI0035308FEB
MWTLKNALVFVCFVVVTDTTMQRLMPSQQVPSNNACQTPLGDWGMCVSLKHCQEVLRLYEQLSVNQATRYSKALRNICYNRVTADNYPILCCTRPNFEDPNQDDNNNPTPANTTSVPPAVTTTLANNEDRITSGGTNTPPETCRVPGDGSDGTCKPLQNCDELIARARQNPTDNEFRKQLQLSNAICLSIGTNICCPVRKKSVARSNNVEWHLPTEDEGCGLTNYSGVKVVGGGDSSIGAWPWMALIGYDRYSLSPFRCGGSLITARHVLTAAHCILRDLSFVRLGEYDLSTETETKHVDIDVVKSARHPDFGERDRRYDIAILYLEKNVEFTGKPYLICPICLPMSAHLRNKSYVGYTPFVAGWGKVTEGGRASNILQELQIPVVENRVCRQTYEANKRLVSNQQFDDTVVCAGDLNGGRDTCGGDSGGPLMVAEPYKGVTRFYELGVVSYGIGCGRIGVPGVYTNVQKYINWILEKLAETCCCICAFDEGARKSRLQPNASSQPQLSFILYVLKMQCTTKKPVAQYNCVTPENYYGYCVQLTYCPQIANVFNVRNRNQAERYVISSQRACGTRSVNGNPVVCCSRPVNPTPQQPQPQPQPTQRPQRQPQPQLQPQPQPQTQAPFTQRPNNPFLPQTTSAPVILQPTPPRIQPSLLTTSRPTQTILSTTEDPTKFVDRLSGDSCVDPKLRSGVCVAISKCPQLVSELYAKSNDPEFADYLRASNRNCGGAGSVACCPTSEAVITKAPVVVRNSNETPKRPLTLEEGCGYTHNSYKKIVGGEVSKKGAWPWAVLLAYPDGSSSSPFKCGGALVTARHVVTAAHCMRNDLAYVRLGEHDLTTDSETRHEDVKIVRKEAHPQYNRRNGKSDVALLWLERNVQFRDTISPICLPTSQELRQKSYISYTPFVVGWGKTMEGGVSANVLQELQIPVFNNDICERSYERINRLVTDDQFDASVLCAGVLSGGKDTCQGDSGGPLMIPETYKGDVRYYLIGVVSYGVGCARPEVPGVYASVQHYIDWILQKIADTT